MQSLIKEDKVRITSSAMLDAASLDYTSTDIKRIVLQLTDEDFYKSMPSHKNAMIWQDVYRKTVEEDGITLYIKLQLLKDTIVISFKEK